MVEPFDTNRDPGDEQDFAETEKINKTVIRDGRNYYITLNADGSLNITKENPHDTSD